MICTDSVTTSGPNGLNPIDPASNDTMTTENQTATQRLTALQDLQRELEATLMAAKSQYQRTRRELADARYIVQGYERSTRPTEMVQRDEAQARLVQLQEQAQTESAQISALEGELNATHDRISALFKGRDGYEGAVMIYREAKAHVAKAESALTDHRAQQQTAADALDKAEQTRATATRDLENALDAGTINRSRPALTKAEQVEGDARTLVGNLQRHEAKLADETESARQAMERAKKRVFRYRAPVLAATLKQQLTGLALDAFAAARLAGSVLNFHGWLADAIDPSPAAIEDHVTAMLAELEKTTALEKTAHP